MNISSILITIVGIVIIIALYVVSRIGQNKLPNNTQASVLPIIKDDDGNAFSSILDDIPATDEPSSPHKNKSSISTKQDKQQLVLFISSTDDQTLDGKLIKQALLDNGLSLGDKDIYHYLIENKEKQLTSLFRIANGVEPWTLKDNDLEKQQLIGLSMVILLPTIIKNSDAVNTFIEKADAITAQVNGVLKNHQQEILSKEERESILNS